MALSPLLPCDVLRAWPRDWRLDALLRAGPEAAFPAPGRFLHPALELRASPRTGGRCVAARAPCRRGELVLVDAPLALGRSRRALLEEAFDRANGPEGEDFREVLLSLCGDRGDRGKRAVALQEGFVPAALVERIVAHNYHVVEPPPVDGRVGEAGGEAGEAGEGGEASGALCGLWPLGSAVNHSLRPNATRAFVGHANCYRLLRDLSPGEELLDNYLDPRLPRSERVGILARVHDMEDEGPDDCDAPAEFLAEIERGRARVQELLQEDRPDAALALLAEVAARCRSCGRRDPAFAEIFRASADAAWQLAGDAEARLGHLRAALEYATAREPASTVSCVLAAELLAAALEAARSGAAAEGLAHADATARRHFEGVYGAEGAYEALNPRLSEQLRAARASPDRGAPAARDYLGSMD